MGIINDKKIGSPILSNGHAAVVPEKLPRKQKDLKQSVPKERSEKNTEKIWKRPQVPDEVLNPLHYTNKKANTALAIATSAHGDVHSQKLQIRMEYDLRNKSRADYWARINTEEGVSLAEVWGTKSGKSRTYIVSPYGKIDIESELWWTPKSGPLAKLEDLA